MKKYQAMYQYEKDIFSVISKGDLPKVGNYASIQWTTQMHKKNRNNNDLEIIEIISSEPSKSCPASTITRVRVAKQS